MKIIITDRFRKEYLKSLRKYFTLELLVDNLKKKHHTFIQLHEPFWKYKLKLNSVDFRGIIFTVFDWKIIPLAMYLKKDKKLGMNISWTQRKEFIKNEHEKSLEEIEKWNYKVF